MIACQRFSILLVTVVGACALPGADGPSREELIWQHRNLGKAFYENPTTQQEAVTEFRKALDLNPNSVRERLNYGLALLRAHETAQAVAELEAVQKLDPALPHTWFNLGVVYQNQGKAAAAAEQFRGAIRLDPNEPVSHYQLGVSSFQTGDLAAAASEFETAARLDAGFGAPRFRLFGVYGRLNRPADAQRVFAEFRAIKEKQDKPGVDEENVDWSKYSEIYDPVADPARSLPKSPPPRFLTRQLSGTADPKTADALLLDFDGDGKPDVLVWSDSGILLYRDGTELVDRGLSALRHVVWVAAGDYDNDGLVDLCVVTREGAQLFRNTGAKGFERQPLPADGTGFHSAVWIDYDHDRDLDLILVGTRSLLLRNDGAKGWEDRTRDFPFTAGDAVSAKLLRFDPEDTKAFDLMVAYAGGARVLYRDRLNGRYEATQPGPIPTSEEPAAAVEADFSGAGRIDRVEVTREGKILYATNQAPAQAWLTVALEGVKSLKIPTGAEVEIKAGSFYARRQYLTVPLTFDLGDHATVDVIRITWPDGLVQNETQKQTRQALHIKEAPRLSGSCPMIFIWNGRTFEFITDVLGVAPLGASSGDGAYFPVNDHEYISIPGESLVEKDGRYEIRITEELHEVSYLDQVQLLTVDHPADTEIVTNEKWKGPPYPDFRLFGVKRRMYPRAAHDERGRDVRSALLHRDGVYVDGFSRDMAGVAGMHTLDLDFGPEAARANRAVLVLTGWVDWADGSTFLKASQEGRPLVSPSLQVKDASGQWKTVIEDMGMPSGKTKTIAVDLAGRFLSASREVRIVTNMCVYWDEVFLGEDSSSPEVRLTALAAGAADLNFRGFSRVQVDPQRNQPEKFDYASVSFESNWNPTPGNYTRYGDVRDLVEEADDRMVVMGSGDELRLRFDTGRLPPLPVDWRRDFLLLVSGWAKDADANTAFSQQVNPLPFHGMTSYPYPSGEQFPTDAAHQQYLQEYNTRPALRLIRPLN